MYRNTAMCVEFSFWEKKSVIYWSPKPQTLHFYLVKFEKEKLKAKDFET